MVKKYLVEGQGSVYVLKHNIAYYRKQSVGELSIVPTIKNKKNYKFLLNYHI